MKTLWLGGLLAVAASAGWMLADSGDPNAADVKPNGKGGGTKDSKPGPGPKGGSSSNGIDYHGGPVLLGTVNVYYIWYGGWTGNTATTILENLAQNLGGSPWFATNTTYYQGTSAHPVSGAVHYGGSSFDSYSQGGSTLTDAQVQAVVSRAISLGPLGGGLPADPNGVYFVLTSADVNETSGFCRTYCGWHTYATIAGSNIKYAFVGNPDRCPSACEEQTSSSPNGNTGADGMASIIGHELSEATTDPNLNAWYDKRGEENADKCAWTFGKTSTASNGSQYNVTLNGFEFLIQQIWVNASGGYCALSYP